MMKDNKAAANWVGPGRVGRPGTGGSARDGSESPCGRESTAATFTVPEPAIHVSRMHLPRGGPWGMGNPSRMHPAPATKSVLPAGILLFITAR